MELFILKREVLVAPDKCYPIYISKYYVPKILDAFWYKPRRQN